MKFEANPNSMKNKMRNAETSVNQLSVVVNKQSELIRFQMESIGNMSRRVCVLEDLVFEKLGVTIDEVSARIAQKEDEAFNLEAIETESEEGDLVRVSVQMQDPETKEFGEEQKVMITKLMQEPYTISEDFEKAVKGAKTGEELMIEENSRQIKTKINRVSRVSQES